MIAFTAQFFKEELTPERIAARMNGLIRLEKNPFMRILPLPLKLWGMQAGAALSSSSGTAVFSNIGRIQTVFLSPVCSPAIPAPSP